MLNIEADPSIREAIYRTLVESKTIHPERCLELTNVIHTRIGFFMAVKFSQGKHLGEERMELYDELLKDVEPSDSSPISFE